jgi:ribosomal protein S18 acetylase RimI-like enzyme
MRPLDRTTRSPDYLIRPYRREDRDQIRFICCETGFLGNPIDPVFSDRELFADYLTRYYTDIEPESSWVGEKDGKVVGYLLSSKRWHLFGWWSRWNTAVLAAKMISRLILGKYNQNSRNFLKWIALRGWRQTPWTPKNAAHFHFNSLPEHRRMGIARDLVVKLLENLREHKVPLVFGQMMTYGNRRTERLYEYLGWKVMAKRRVTKYEEFLDQEMYLTTIMKDLTQPDRPTASTEKTASLEKTEQPVADA